MKRSKEQKGITLIALIVTIVVLLILAAVAIAAVQNDGIIGRAQNAASKYNEAQENEQTILNGYLSILDNSSATAVEPKVGQYVSYDVNYTDVYNLNKTFNSENGWRYFGTEEGTGNHLLISTGIPVIVDYNPEYEDNIDKWWGTTGVINEKFIYGLLNNINKIPYYKVSLEFLEDLDSDYVIKNSAMGLFDGVTIGEGDSSYMAIGEYFKSTTQGNKILNVKTLTLQELNAATNSANDGVENYVDREPTSIDAGFMNLTGTAEGLFDLYDIEGMEADHYYWLASPRYDEYAYDDTVHKIDCVWGAGDAGSDYCGLRPVIVLSSNIQFVDVNGDGILEIR